MQMSPAFSGGICVCLKVTLWLLHSGAGSCTFNNHEMKI